MRSRVDFATIAAHSAKRSLHVHDRTPNATCRYVAGIVSGWPRSLSTYWRTMTDSRKLLLRFGATADCSDGAFGELVDAVIAPVSRRVTHLVVVPDHHDEVARMVPLELLAPEETAGSGLRLRCTLGELHALPGSQEFAYVRIAERPPLDDSEHDVGIEEVLSVPGYTSFELYPLRNDDRVAITYDRIPKGELEVRHASEVCCSNGERIGRLDGLVLDETGTITQVILERGHLWGRHRLTIPASAVDHFDMDRVTLTLSRSEIEELIPVR
jgi:hypothetical protein